MPKFLMRKRDIKNWFIVIPIAWMGIIFLFSHQPGSESADLSGSITSMIIKFFSALGFHLEKELAHSLIRSLAHFLIFFVLGALWYISFRVRGMMLKKAAVISVAIGMIYAVTDEFHQLMVPGRACELKDVLIDSAGVLLAVFLGCLIKWKKIMEV